MTQIGKHRRPLPTECINPQRNRQSLSRTPKGPWRVKNSCARNQIRGVQRVLLRLSHPQPVAHGRPSTSIQFAAAAGKPCGVDTGCFRTAEPPTDENQTFSASQEPHTCWRTFHPLIKGDEEMSWFCFTDSMQSARGAMLL
jgi:hypothetical protein